FLIVLAMVTLRRAIPFKVKNIGFFLNHFGLWLTLLAAGLSSSDLQRLSVNLIENEPRKNIAVSQNGDMYQLPFSLKLLDFNIIEYNPQIGIFDIASGRFVAGSGQDLPYAAPNLETNLAGWHLKVLKYYPQALYKNGTLQPTDSITGYPAALVFARNLATRDTVRGWISTGSVYLHADYVSLKGTQYLMLNAPAPKKFYSKLVVYKDSIHGGDTVQIEVNKPYSAGGWTLYQTGYDQQMRKWSTLSILEAVRDPWLPVVYIGIAFLLVGALYMFWIGKDKKE
ncbi:MAG TPA: cytochrome c biogenesis protein ResB, partial [Bacteroidales bacterium]